MDNDIFINKLIAGTKSSKLIWKIVSGRSMDLYPSFYLQKGETIVLLERYESIVDYDAYGGEIHSTISNVSICDTFFNKLSTIYETDLKQSANIDRLYRLVERQVNNVDDLMKGFVDDIDTDDEC